MGEVTVVRPPGDGRGRDGGRAGSRDEPVPRGQEAPATPRRATPAEPPRRSVGGTLGALLGAFVSALYLANLGVGVVELLPDNLPLLGNLDEAGATGLLLASLRYLLRSRRAAAGRGRVEP